MLGTCNAIGDIDLATEAEFRRNLLAAIDGADTRLVVVDFSLVTFVSSAAFHALTDATVYAAARHRVLVIRNLQPFHAKVLRLCDRTNELNLDPHSALLATVAQVQSRPAPLARLCTQA